MLYRKLRPDFGHRSFALAQVCVLGGIAAIGGLFLDTDGGAGGGGGTGAGGTPDPPKPPAPTGSGGDDPPASPAITFKTQKEFDDHAKGIRLAAERDALKKVATDLGVDPDKLADVKAALEAKRAAELAAMTEADRKLAEAKDKETAAEKATREAGEATRRADLTVALYQADGDDKPPVRSDRFASALVLAQAQLAADSTLDVAGAIAKVREQAPEFFGQATGTPPPPGVRPGTPPAGGGNSPKSGIERGRERALAKRKQGGTDDQNGHDPLASLGRRVGS